MLININIGILGHVDSGKTTLSKTISQISSTAAFDKNPQSQERGITLDLGFSALVVDAPDHLSHIMSGVDKRLQLTLVDCPGHASLIRTIIGGAQIIDMMILVVDVQKGIQTQTAECIVIGELTCKNLIVVINKIDCLEESIKRQTVAKLEKRIGKALDGSALGKPISICAISALTGEGISEFIDVLKASLFLPIRKSDEPFLFAVDHCFAIKGQGTVCTGTVLQGKININDVIEIPLVKELKKVKSMQMFRQSVQNIKQGDRAGLCITQFDSSQMERGLLAAPGFIRYVSIAVINLNRIKYYKHVIKSKSKFHISIGHETVMGSITLFHSRNPIETFDITKEYEFIDEVDETNSNNIFALIEFERPTPGIPNHLMIASKLDDNVVHTNSCRIAFFGNLIWMSDSKNYPIECLPLFKIYKNKMKKGTIQRIINDREIIVQNLFKKESNRDVFVGKRIELSTGEDGIIDSTFGQSSKVKIKLNTSLPANTNELIKNKTINIVVFLKFKKYIFNKNKNVFQ